jgi:hypothetical protein
MRRPPVDQSVVVEALRTGIEDVVLPATFVDFDWHTTVITPADDLEGDTTRLITSSRDWERIGAAAELESAAVGAHRRDVPSGLLPPDPTANPINANSRMLPGRPATLAWSVHRWAVRDWPAFSRATTHWLLQTAERLGADSGFITYDVLDAVVPASAWEIVTGVSPTERDFARHLWGYGWGTLLSPTMVETVGGPAALATVPTGSLRSGPGGQLWIQLGDDPANVDPSAVTALRQVLLPVLPVGQRHVEEYLAPPDNPYEVRHRYVV